MEKRILLETHKQNGDAATSIYTRFRHGKQRQYRKGKSNISQ